MQQVPRAVVAVLVAALALVAACSSPAQAPSEASATTDAPTTRTVTHALGTTEVPASPARVVSASVTMTGPLLGLDVPVVGTGTTRPGGVADPNGFFLQWAGQAVDRGVAGLGGPTVRVESVAAQQPDVIVGSAVGADAVTPEIYAQLSAIAPTIVLDHSRLSWQELSAQLGRNLGREAQATAAEQEYTARASAIGAGLDTSREAVAMTVTDNGFNVFTAESAQGKLLTGLGLRLKAVAPSGASGLGGSEVRRDVVPVAGENAGVFGDASLFFVNATDEDVAGYRTAQPVLGSLPAFAENRVHALGPESFRLDRFSAAAVLDRLEQQGS